MKSVATIILISLIFIGFTSCNSAQDKGFITTGEIKGYGDGKIVFTHNIPRARRSDTINIVNDRFEYRDSLQSPSIIFFRILGNDVLDRPHVQGMFMAENTTMRLDASLDEISDYIIEGSNSNDELRAIYDNMREVSTGFNESRTAYRQAMREQTDTELLEKEFIKQRELYIDHLINIENFENSHAAAYILFNNFSNFTRPQVSQILSNFSSDLDHNVYLDYMRNRIESEESIAIGVQAPDFALLDPDGKQYSIKDYRGKHLLIAFSASWCTWCKREIPYLKAVYEKFDNDDLAFLTINLDTSRDLWLSDIEQDNLPWPVISDLKAFQGPVVRDYAIFAIPRIFLIDAEGVIQGMNLRGDRIMEAVSQQLGN